MSDRTVYLMREVDEKIIGDVIMQLLSLDQKNHGPIRLFIYSSGGDWECGKHLCHTLLNYLQSPVITIGVRLVASAAVPILASGTLRLAFPKTELNFHEVYNDKDDLEDTRWTGSKLHKEGKTCVEYTKELIRYCTKKLPSHRITCGLTSKDLLARIHKAKDGEYSIGARTARELGFIDGIVRNEQGIRRYERQLLRRRK